MGRVQVTACKTQGISYYWNITCFS